jgi:hypothetical protein
LAVNVYQDLFAFLGLELPSAKMHHACANQCWRSIPSANRCRRNKLPVNLQPRAATTRVSEEPLGGLQINRIAH